MTARQAATIIGAPCVNCHEAPCGCNVTIVAPLGRGDDRTLRRYAFPDGSVLRLNARYAELAVAQGAELVEELA